MGRRGNAERLANPAFKMAAILMADFLVFKRPVHEACKGKKVVCLKEAVILFILQLLTTSPQI